MQKLESENIRLQLIIDSILKSQPEYSYSPFVFPYKENLKLGEEYIADIRLSALNKKNPPIVLLGYQNDSTHTFIPNGDTLQYDLNYESALYKIIPSRTGKFTWAGQIISNIPGQKYPFQFSVTYNVSK